MRIDGHLPPVPGRHPCALPAGGGGARRERRKGYGMTNTRKRGRYYAGKVKAWLEERGWSVYPMEHTRVIFRRDNRGNKKTIFVTADTAGADWMAMDGKRILFVQVRAGIGHRASGRKALNEHPYPQNTDVVLPVVAECLPRKPIRWFRAADGEEVKIQEGGE